MLTDDDIVLINAGSGNLLILVKRMFYGHDI